MRHLKLQQPPRPRVRVRELARALDILDTDLLTWLREHGEWVPHVQSFVEEPVAERARAAFRPATDAEAAATGGRRATADPPAPKPLRGLTPPTPHPVRENNPFLGDLNRFRPRATPSRGTAKRQDPLSSSGSPTLPDYSAAGAFRASEAMAPFEWAIRGVEDQKQEWLNHGLGPRDARVAQACQDARLHPADLSVSVSGWTVLDRITRGEAPRQVARLLARQREQDRDSG